jgi:hypothetical protein
MFSTVQLVPGDATKGALLRLIGSDVEVMLKEPAPARAGHLHAPLVASVESVSKARVVMPEPDAATSAASKAGQAPPEPDGTAPTVSKVGDAKAEPGADAAAASVRGFYEALAEGSGSRAAEFVVPERRIGPFSPAAMTAFYSALPERLQVISLDPAGPHTLLVRYRFRSTGRLCIGRAVVSTVSRNGASYIFSIKAPDGC